MKADAHVARRGACVGIAAAVRPTRATLEARDASGANLDAV